MMLTQLRTMLDGAELFLLGVLTMRRMRHANAERLPLALERYGRALGWLHQTGNVHAFMDEVSAIVQEAMREAPNLRCVPDESV